MLLPGLDETQQMLGSLRKQKESQSGVEQLRTKQKIYQLEEHLEKLWADAPDVTAEFVK